MGTFPLRVQYMRGIMGNCRSLLKKYKCILIQIEILILLVLAYGITRHRLDTVKIFWLRRYLNIFLQRVMIFSVYHVDTKARGLYTTDNTLCHLSLNTHITRYLLQYHNNYCIGKISYGGTRFIIHTNNFAGVRTPIKIV